MAQSPPLRRSSRLSNGNTSTRASPKTKAPRTPRSSPAFALRSKASRPPRSGPASTNIPRPGAQEIRKPSTDLSKIHTSSSGSNNPKCSIPSPSRVDGRSYKRKQPLYQRVLSALIVEEENDTERRVLPRHAAHSLSCDDEEQYIEDRILQELHNIGIYPKTMPDFHNHDNTAPVEETTQLKDPTCKSAEQNGADGILNAGSSDLFGTGKNPIGEKRDILHNNVSGVGAAFSSITKRKRTRRETSNGFLKAKDDYMNKCSNGDGKTKIKLNKKTKQLGLLHDAPVNNKLTRTNPKKDGGYHINLEKTSSAPTSKEIEEEESLDLTNFPELDFNIDELDMKGMDLDNGQQNLATLLDFNVDQDFSTALQPSVGAGSSPRSKRKRNDSRTCNGVSKTKDDCLSKCSNGDVEAKTKPKKKTKQTSLQGNAFVDNKSTESNQNKDGGCNNNPEKSSSASKKVSKVVEGELFDLANFSQQEFNIKDEHIIGKIDLGGHKDLTSWLNFEDDLQGLPR